MFRNIPLYSTAEAGTIRDPMEKVNNRQKNQSSRHKFRIIAVFLSKKEPSYLPTNNKS
jgi:hypothetical protein